MSDPILLAERSEAVATARAEIRALLAGGRTDRESLHAVLARLSALAARHALFGPGEFDATDRPTRFLLGEDEDGRLSLSLTVLPRGFVTRPHTHGTWAAIAAVEGVEVHRLYRHGRAGLEVIGEVVVQRGAGIVLMPEDIHAVRIPGPAPARLLQLYGLALERAPRREYDPPTGRPWPVIPAEAS